MKFGIRKPSLKKMIAAKLSPARYIRHNLGLKISPPFGLITHPKKAVYNRIYQRVSISPFRLFKKLMRK